MPGCSWSSCCQQPTPVPPPYVSGKCWDVHNGAYVDNGVVMSCWRGGTRMCSNGQWRVLNGQCDGEDYYNPNTGKSEVLVGAPAPGSSAPAPAPVVVGSSAP